MTRSLFLSLFCNSVFLTGPRHNLGGATPLRGALLLCFAARLLLFRADCRLRSLGWMWVCMCVDKILSMTDTRRPLFGAAPLLTRDNAKHDVNQAQWLSTRRRLCMWALWLLISNLMNAHVPGHREQNHVWFYYQSIAGWFIFVTGIDPAKFWWFKSTGVL